MQGLVGFLGILVRANRGDRFIQAGQGRNETRQDMQTRPCLTQQELRTTLNHFAAERGKSLENFQNSQLTRPFAIQQHHVVTEGRFGFGLRNDLIEHDLRVRALLDVQNQAVLTFGGLIAHHGNIFQNLVLDHFHQGGVQSRLVHTVGQLV